MELLQLTYFCSAAETGNFSKTAAKYSVPPSNISQTISRLEKELGVTLFDRFANKISINERGRQFYSSVKKALMLIEQAKLSVDDTSDVLSGEIRISVCVNRRVVTRSIEKFRSAYPQISFFISHDLSDDASDLIIADGHFRGRNMKKELLLSENIVLAISKNNPLSDKSSITADDLRDQRFISMPNGSSLFRYTNMICNDMGFSPDIAIQSDDPYYVRKYVEMGLGIAFMPSVSWQGQFSDNMTFITPGNYKRNTYVFWNGDKYMSRGVEAFLKELITECKKLSDFA